MKRTIIFLFISLLSGCQNVLYPDQSDLEWTFEVAFGEHIFIADKNISLFFDEILEDSRCPEGVTCVWSGNAKIVIKFNDEKTTLKSTLPSLR